MPDQLAQSLQSTSMRVHKCGHAMPGSHSISDSNPISTYLLPAAADVESVVRACRSSDVCIFMLGTTMLAGDKQVWGHVQF